MRAIVGGGTGFIGRHVTKLLTENGYKVTAVSRKPGPNSITWNELNSKGLPEDCSAVISLSGENLLNPMKRWNKEFQEDVWSSRVDRTTALSRAISHAKSTPKVYVSISGVSYYRPDPKVEYTEDTVCQEYDFLSRLTKAWEEAARVPDSVNVRQVVVRSGVVLGRDGGMIKNIFPTFFMGAGGRIGSGQQWFPWIHVADIAGIVTHAVINDHVTGILNGVAPEPATNSDFTKAFSKALWRPAIFPVPAFVMNTIMGEERGKVILDGQKVYPKRTLASGYKYAFPDLASACKDCAHLVYTEP